MIRSFSIPIRIHSVANLRESWQARHRRNKSQANTVWLMLANYKIPVPCVVTMIRIAPRLLDDDNLASSFKHCRDCVAALAGVTDGPKGPITWRYAQRKGKTGEYAITIEIEPLDLAE